MKKWIWIGSVIVVTASVLLLVFFGLNFACVNTNFAKNITLEVKTHTYGGEKREGFVVDIDQDDVATLKRIFRGIANNAPPICPWGDVYLIFSSGNKSLTIYLAGDGCNTVHLVRNGQKFYFTISEENNELIKEILAKYGVKWNHSI